jgi:Lon protease-like protein
MSMEIFDPYHESRGTSRLVLLPLADEVCFPQTELRLQVIDPDYQELVSELFLEVGDRAWLGTVLLRPEHEESEDRGPVVFTAGTATRLLDYEMHDDGCDIVLRGEYRFQVERELGTSPRLEGLVRPLTEPHLGEGIEVQDLQRELLDCTISLARQLGDRFALDDEQFSDLLCGANFEQVVNQLSTHLDLSPLRKLKLLQDPLPERARHLAEILRSRCQVLDTLAPFRHLATAANHN